jgi:alanine dehydrogenase
MTHHGTLILTRNDLAQLMTFDDYMDAVENAFLFLASGDVLGAGILDLPGRDGMFHIKGASVPLKDKIYVAVKVNGNFPDNKVQFGLPTIQGAIVLCDGIRGLPLAFLDSTEVTLQRTGAATALAAKRLARSNSRVVMICGCGKQGRVQLSAIKHALPISRAFAFDANEEEAARFANEMNAALGIPIDVVREITEGARQSDVIVTCTTSRRFYLKKEDITPGTFIAAVGADSHDKQEIDPALMASSKVVADILDQSARIGDLHHAIQTNRMTRGNVYAELHEVISGSKAGRETDQEVIVFDSTGTALQDVTASAVAYERAIDRGAGTVIDLIG